MKFNTDVEFRNVYISNGKEEFVRSEYRAFWILHWLFVSFQVFMKMQQWHLGIGPSISWLDAFQNEPRIWVVVEAFGNWCLERVVDYICADALHVQNYVAFSFQTPTKPHNCFYGNTANAWHCTLVKNDRKGMHKEWTSRSQVPN